MRNEIIGALLRYHRIRRNLSQEGLCKGICVVSYLSKIEQGKADAGADILHALFERLQVDYCDDEDVLKKESAWFHAFWEKLEYQEDAQSEITHIKAQKETLINSPLWMEYMLFSAYEQIEVAHQGWKADRILKELEEASACMDENQRYRYLLLYSYHSDADTRLNKILSAGRIQITTRQVIDLGSCYLSRGDYFEAMEQLQKGYDMASEEGDIYQMMQVSVLLGNCYSCQNAEALMMKYYRKAERMARMLHETKTQLDLAYNIGSTYLEWKQYEKAEEKLLYAYGLEKDSLSIFMLEHKLALLYIETDRKQEGERYVQQMDAHIQETFPLVYHKMLEFIHLRYEKEYLRNPRYALVLKEIYDMDQSIFFGYRLFHTRYLIEVLKHQRRYKEAFLIQQQMENRMFPEKYE